MLIRGQDMAKSRKRQDTAASTSSAQAHRASGATLDPGDALPDINGQDRRTRIARRAYELYLARGGSHGSDWEDWLRAERELLGSGSHERPE